MSIRSRVFRVANPWFKVALPAADLRGQEIATLKLYGHILGNVRDNGLDNCHEDEGDPLYYDK